MATENERDAASEWYLVSRQRVRDEGVIPMAPAGDGVTPAAAQIVRLHNPIEYLIVRFNAYGKGGPASITVPHPKQVDTNQAFLTGWQSAPNPKVIESGIHIWVIEGAYLYVLINPAGLDSDFPTGKDPYDPVGKPSDYTIPSSVFSKYITHDSVLGPPIIPVP